jgi:thiamine-monophosphate kinase
VAEGATIDDALGGGEDYELLAAVPDARAVEAARVELKEAFGVNLTDIGCIVEGADLTTVGRDGTEHQLEPTGWDHFR